MMKRIYVLIVLAFALSLLSGVTAMHEPPLAYIVGESVTLRLDVMDGLEGVSSINLAYKPVTAENYSRKQMLLQEPGSTSYALELNSGELAENDIQYYFEFVLGTEQVQRFPEELEGGVPFTLKAEYQPGREEKGFVLLSTDADFPQDEGYVLAVSYIALIGKIDPSSLEVWVRGKNVTKKAVITENTLVYRDKNPRPGACRAIITAKTLDGEKIKSPSFITDVKRSKNKPVFDMNGNLGFALNLYDHDEAEGYDPSGYIYPNDDHAAWLDFYTSLGKLKANANLYYSSLEDSNAQPVNRFRLGLDLAALGFQVGDYSPHLSPLVMSNKNVRGVYGKLIGRYIGLEVSVGEMVRKTEADGVSTSSTFRQEALGGRLRLGSDRGLSMSFSLSRNRDIISSLDEALYISIDPVTADTLFSVTPQDNLVASLDTKINIPGLRTLFGLEVAGSLYNRNTWPGPITSEEVEQYISGMDFIDPVTLAEIFVINKNMVPLLPGLANCAANAYFRSMILNHQIYVNASVTGPAFNSLSTWSQAQDTQQLSITDMFSLGKYLFLSGGYSLQKDNFSQSAQETNEYKTWFVQSTIRLFKLLSIRAGYFDTEASNEDNRDLADGHIFVPYQRESNSLNLGIGYLSSNTYIFPYQAELLFRTGSDLGEVANPLEGSYENANNSVSLSLSSKLEQIPLRLQAVVSLARQNNDRVGYALDPSTLDNLNLYFKAGYSLFSDKLKPYISLRNVGLSGDQDSQSYMYFTGGLEAYPIRNMTVSTELSNSTYKNEARNDLNRGTLTWRLTLNQRF